MSYDNLTDASSVGKAIPEAVVGEILKNIPQQSAALQFMRRVPLATRTARQPVLSALPVAYFVNGDTGLKQTTEMEWKDKTLTVEEIATILPIPINVVDDLSFDFWAEARPLIEEAIGILIDGAVFFGFNKPNSWPDSIVAGATAAGNYIDLLSTDMPGQTGWGPKYVDKISDLMSKVEDDGYEVNGFVVPRSFKGVLRKLRDADGNKLADIAGSTYEGVAFRPAMDGQWASGLSKPVILAGDWTKAVIGVRKDITYELFREGVIQDATGKIVFNLMQQDMVAMRVTMRLAYQTVNPITRAEMTEANRYPFSILRTPSS